MLTIFHNLCILISKTFCQLLPIQQPTLLNPLNLLVLALPCVICIISSYLFFYHQFWLFIKTYPLLPIRVQMCWKVNMIIHNRCTHSFTHSH